MNIENAKQLLFDIYGILEKLGIPAFLHCGTALGAYRDSAIIPYDEDVDLAVRYEDIAGHFDEITEQAKTLGYKVISIKSPFVFVRALKIFGEDCKVDIASYLKDGNKRFCPASRQNYALVLPNSMFHPSTYVEMYGRTFWMHNPPDKYLIENYGEDWRTPRPGDSKSRCRVYGYRPGESLLARNHSGSHLNNVHKDGGYYEYLNSDSFCDAIMPKIAAHVKDSVLDVGCGRGRLADYIKPEIRYHGFDGSKTVISAAQKTKSQTKSPNRSFSTGRLENFYLRNTGEYHTIVFSGVLCSVIKAGWVVEVIENYLRFFNARRFIICDLQKRDRSEIGKRFTLISSEDVLLGTKAIKPGLRRRFVEVYEA